MNEEDAVFMKRVISLKRNVAVLVCVALISVLLPEIIHAASQPLSSKPAFLKNSLSLLMPYLSSFHPVFAFIPLNPAMLNILSPADKKPVENPANTQANKKDKDNDSYKDHGNSTSTKPANGKD